MGILAAYPGTLFKLIPACLQKCGKGKSETASLTVQGRTVDFKNTLIIMTSNVGSSVIEKGGGGLGFQLDTNEEDSSYNRIKTLVNEELKHYFRPEFLNRQAPPYCSFPHAGTGSSILCWKFFRNHAFA